MDIVDLSEFRPIDCWGVKPGLYMVNPRGQVYSNYKGGLMKTFIDNVTENYAGIEYAPLIKENGKCCTYNNRQTYICLTIIFFRLLYNLSVLKD